MVNANKMPEELEWEFRFDLLVDDELPEDERRTLLTSLDLAPTRWRELAIRFLQRQSERRAVRQFIAGTAVDSLAVRPVPRKRKSLWWQGLRVAASLLIVAGLGVYGGLKFGQKGEGEKGTEVAQESVNVELPSAVAGQEGPVSVNVPVTAAKDSNALNETYSFLDPRADTAGATRHLVIVPQGHNKAVIVPVTAQTIH